VAIRRLLGVGGEPSNDNAKGGFTMLSAVVVRWELCPERGVCREKDEMVGMWYVHARRGLASGSCKCFR
jgi:hypothetical protein